MSSSSLQLQNNVACNESGVTPLKAKFYRETMHTPELVLETSKIVNGVGTANGAVKRSTVTRTESPKVTSPLPKTVPTAEASPFVPTITDGDAAVQRKRRVAELVTARFVDPYTPMHQNGPDYVLPTNDTMTWVPNGAVKLRIASEGVASQAPLSVVTFFKRTVDRFPTRVGLVVKRRGEWVRWTYAKYWSDVRTAAKGFIKLGLEPFHGVGILGFNAPEWFISNLGAIFAGGLGAGIYTTNSAEACQHVLEDSSANIVVVENENQLKKILKVRSELPHLKAIVQYSGEPSSPDVFSWNDLLEIGRSVPDEVLDRRIKGLSVNQCCTLVYTSGTTGKAKGAMLSHDCMTYLTQMPIKAWNMSFGTESFLSYLPLSHIAAQVAEFYIGFGIAAEIYFAPPEALKGNLVETLKEVMPHRILGVPRVWEKMCEKLKEAERDMTPLKRAAFSWARGLALRYNLNRMNGSTSAPLFFSLANKLVLKKVRQALGFERTVLLVTGAAPIARDVLEYFMSLNLVITECYGMSESCGPHLMNLENHFRIGSVGPPLPGLEVRLDNADKDGVGEVCMRGRNVFMGYLNLAEKTEEALDKENWLHSGDLGRLEKDFVFITGRIKEIIITAGGENVAPVLIEDNVKVELPCISNCMLIGDNRKFLSLLITLKTEIDLNTLLPTDKLTQSAQEWCRSVGTQATTVHDVLRGPDDKIMAAIQKGIDRANLKAVSNAQRIQKWIILPLDFSIPGGELGPTMKLKRPSVVDKYRDTIDNFYV